MGSTLTLDQIAIAVITGILPFLFISTLPSINIVWLLAAIIVLLALFNHVVTRFFVIFLLSFVWGMFCANHLINQVERYAGTSANIQGTVLSINMQSDSRQGILFQVERIDGRELSFRERFQLPLYFPKVQQNIANSMLAGQIWQGNIQFRAVHSRLNQGGYNRQRWAMANHQPLSGHVKSLELLQNSSSIRQRLVSHILFLIEKNTTKDILLALAFGERSMMQPERRQVFLQTGTAHLMAISGLHISLAALLGWFVARGAQFLLPAKYIGSRFPLFTGWVIAAVYVWLAGGNPPALRAFGALSVWFVLRLRGVNWSSWQVWIRILAILLISDPMMILSDSLWLSCLAVAVLIFWFQWAPLPVWIPSKYRAIALWVHIQIAMMILLIPMQAIIFHGISWTALFGNLVAVPIVSFISVPAILFGLIFCTFPSLAILFWWIADRSLIVVLFVLNKLQDGWISIPSQMILVSFIGWLLILFWCLSLWRCGLFTPWITLFLIIFPFWSKPKETWRIDMLDVGHGLAIAIRKGSQVVLYDTGNRWDNSSMAEREILPFLRWHGLELEGIILSHQHLDHAGGLAEIQKYYPQAWLRTSTRSLGGSCQQGDYWHWQELTFEVLWPQAMAESAENPDSCVVRISDGRHSMLLTGDLEKTQELILVRTLGNSLNSNILQTPHHGSKTSSSISFIQAVNPEVTLTSVARYNPWRLPAENVVQRYKASGIKWISTAELGQSSVLFYKDYYDVSGLRTHFMPRWYHQWFGS